MRNPSALGKLLVAYYLFQDEAKKAAKAGDMELRKAILEDAAEVSMCIQVIERGDNRGKYDAAILEEIANDAPVVRRRRKPCAK